MMLNDGKRYQVFQPTDKSALWIMFRSEVLQWLITYSITKDKKDISEDILKICNENLPEYMVPVEIEFLDDMPRTSAGKIDYRALEK